MEDLESVMRRIAKLLAIAQDDRANANEAAAAAGQAERIMRKYQIDHADVILTQLKKGDDMGEEFVVASAKTNGTRVKIVPPWASIMSLAVGRLNDCHCIISRPNGDEGDAGVLYRGFSSDVKVAAWMFSYLVSTTLRLCNEYKKTEAYAELGRASVNSYRSGVASGICSSLNSLRREKEREMQQNSTGTALVVAKMQIVEQKYGVQRFKSVKRAPAVANSFASGYIAGREVNIGIRAVNGPSTSNTPLLGGK